MQGMKTPAADRPSDRPVGGLRVLERVAIKTEERARFRERFTAASLLVRARKCGCSVSFRDIDFTRPADTRSHVSERARFQS